MQRRVYDALNVLSAMKIIKKDKYNIIYNHDNRYIPSNYLVRRITNNLTLAWIWLWTYASKPNQIVKAKVDWVGSETVPFKFSKTKGKCRNETEVTAGVGKTANFYWKAETT